MAVGPPQGGMVERQLRLDEIPALVERHIDRDGRFLALAR